MSMFFIFMALIVGAIAFFHYTQGFFSATLSAIIAIFSAVLALSYHETIVETFLGGTMADSANAMVLLVLFAAIYTAIRTVFDQLISGGMAMPAVANKVGGAIMGVVAGVFAAGVCAFAAQTMSFNPSIMGYSRVNAEESSASIQENADQQRRKQHPVYDQIATNNPLNQAEDAPAKMFLPVDDILVDTVKLLSDRGSLATSKPLASVHPDWLMELFGQRLGIEAGGRRVAMNLAAGKGTDVVAATGKDPAHPDAGVYLIDRALPQKLGEQSEISRINVTGPFTPTGKGQIGIIIRCYFGSKAMDPKNNLIEVSCGAVHLVTQHQNDAGEMEWTDYYPSGTFEDGAVFRQRADDFLFVDPTENSAIDFVFVVDLKGFVQSPQPPPDAKTATPAAIAAWRNGLKVSDGTFIEVKRLAREDLSGQPLQDMNGLNRGKTGVVRKVLVKKPPPPPDTTPGPDAPDPAQVPILSKKLTGTWEATLALPEGEVPMTFTYLANGTFSGTGKFISGATVGATITQTGTWKAKSATVDGTLTVVLTSSKPGQPPVSETNLIHFDSDDQFVMKDEAGSHQVNYTRKAGTGTGTGSQTPPKTITVPPDTSLQLLALPEENRKFYQAISVPAGTSGEVAVAGGKVTILDGKIAGLTLNDADPAQLKGAGEQVNQFMQPDNTVLVQCEAVPGTGSWGWKDRLDQIKGFDAAGKEYPLVGYWAVVNGKLVARFNPDGGLSLADYKPTAPPTQMWLMFKGVDSAPITKVMIGQAPVNVKQ